MRALQPAAGMTRSSRSNGAVVRTAGGGLLWRGNAVPGGGPPAAARAVRPWRNALVFTFDLVGPRRRRRPRRPCCWKIWTTLHGSIQPVDGSRTHASIRRVATAGGRLSPGRRRRSTPVQAMLCGTMERMHAAEARLENRVICLRRGLLPHRVPGPRPLHPRHHAARAGRRGPRCCSFADRSAAWPAAADTMAMGDNWNDVPMLRRGGHCGGAEQRAGRVCRQRARDPGLADWRVGGRGWCGRGAGDHGPRPACSSERVVLIAAWRSGPAQGVGWKLCERVVTGSAACVGYWQF